jgi:hypothetical protein
MAEFFSRASWLGSFSTYCMYQEEEMGVDPGVRRITSWQAAVGSSST